ncbi:RNA-directed DNA polymerase, eukaryota [Tanacetum coccineum]
MSSSLTSFFTKAPDTCVCNLPVRVLTAWTNTNPCRRFIKPGKKKCETWDWYDLELESDWYLQNLYEMYLLLNPHQRRQLGNKMTRQQKIEVLEAELAVKVDEVKAVSKSLTFWNASVGKSGGILCVWDPNAFKKLNSTASDYFVMIQGNWVSNGKLLLIISVYAPQELSEKKSLWDYLCHVIDNWKGSVIIMGDFNEVRNKNERFGTIFNVHGANAFNSFISMANLEEVPLGGCSFTWCHRSASKMSKLDRFLMSESLLSECPNLSAITLDRFLSDHRPILLRESTHDYGPIPFRFFHYWLEMEGFENFVNEVWREAPVDNSNAMINMMNKLKYLKKKIRVWNGMRQSPKTRKHVLKQELADLEMIIDKGDASSDTLHKRAEVVKSIQEVDKLCAMEASQKAKIKWAIEGDENSKYYHGILNKKRNQLSIRGVLVEGDWVENPNMVKNEFLNHFKNRFDRPKSVRPMLNMEFPHHLNSMQQLDLEAEVSNEEIKKAVWDCGVDKSPGPDGFTFGFYKRFWSLIEKDVLAAVKYFFHYSRIPKGCNSSFIALIPKTPEAKMVKDFRPISLIGSLYKIIAKILANRLVVVLGDIVNEVQSAFVADRQILDGPFILNEVLQWCKLKKKHSFILKIDFEKAYDSVRWDYLDDVLRKFGFGEKWCGWIQECLRSSWGSVLVNGSPTEEFQFFKGLKQGDPLSPFIFILVMESLHISFKRVVDAGMFNGIVLNSVMHLSHMFYADDAVFMGQWSTKNIDTIIYVLKCFHRASGLSINLSKSKLLGVVVSEDRVVQAANRIGCGVLKAPFAYLGSKVGGNMSRIKSWDEIVDKMVDRLSKWKMKTLSIGGRLTLLKAVLGSMPIYHMSIFKVPMKVLQRMESIRSRFFSGVDLNSKKSIWVKWSKVLCSKEKGGLGVSSLYALNRALMCKWVWRFTTQKNLLWTRVIKAIHGEDGKNGSGFKVGYKSIWRSILQEVETLKIKGIHLNNFMQKKLGNGADTYFWEDLWHGDMVLKQIYPRLYALEVKKTVDVVSKLSQENLTWSFHRAPRSRVEQDQLTDLTTYVEGVVLGVTPDRWYWTLDGSGEFSVASARKVIDDNRFPEVSTQTRWIKAVPIKVNIHAWKVRMDCLPTRLNISRRGIDILSILCPIRGSVTESNADHTRLISKSIFITNFPDVTTSKDLWVLCQSYGTVVDVFIPNRMSKAGKRFAFVRFIKVDNVERLVGNLCTLWIGRKHLQANVARFDRDSIPSKRVPHKFNHVAPTPTSFVSDVKGVSSPPIPLASSPTLVLDDSCMVAKDLDNFVMGEVRQFSSINNLSVLLHNEGFLNIEIVYLGGLWVMIKLGSAKTKLKFMKHTGVASWFSMGRGHGIRRW